MSLLKIAWIFLLFFPWGQTAEPGQPHAPVGVILDTDFGPDYDDVGALTLLQGFADKGWVRILATCGSCDYPNAAAAIDVLNTYFGRPSIPIGMVRGKAVHIADWQHWSDTLIARYPHAIRSNAEVPDAVTVDRRQLALQPDHSVTIITIGFLTNMARLLQSGPDSLSPLTGLDLVKKKVRLLVSMAGSFPSGKEFNLDQDSTASRLVFSQWPTPVIFTGVEIGMKIHTGIPLIHNTAIRHSPVKDVFSLCIPMAPEDSLGRSSWDETAVLIGVRGWAPYYRLVPGRIICNPDGSDRWDSRARGQYYVLENRPPLQVGDLINGWLQHPPSRH